MVVIDRTGRHFGSTLVNVLTVGIAHRRMTVPVVLRALPGGGSSGEIGHTNVLNQFLQVIDASRIEADLADREFISTG